MAINEDIVTLLKATGNYTYARISNPIDKEAYYQAMINSIAIIQDSYISARFSLEEARAKPIKKPFFSNADPKKYHKLAYDQTFEIVDSIMRRFVDGGHDDIPRNYKNKPVIELNGGPF